MRSILVTWVGRTDLIASEGKGVAGAGPVAGALEERRFDGAVLLCNYPEGELARYMKWLRGRVAVGVDLETRRIALTNPTDYVEVYKAVTSVLQPLGEAGAGDVDLTFHLSPGTPTMAVVWILLASSRFPAKLIQSSQQRGVEDVQLPFEIAAEFVPDLVRRSRQIQDLTAATPPAAAEFSAVIHRCEAMRLVIERARRAALWDVPVLIEGESGTGKELLATAIHAASPRNGNRLVVVNCGAIPETLVESQLFGHERGAFTGADRQHRGFFEQAHKGTLFLDEVGELPLQAQVRLLRAVQFGTISRVGGLSDIEVDVRIVAATNRALTEEVRSGRFRQDLFYRLAVARLEVPPLRAREGDLTLLVDNLMESINARQRAADPQWRDRSLASDARRELLTHSWPGNVRELVNTLTRAMLWSDGVRLNGPDIRSALLPSVEKSSETILHRQLGTGLDVRLLVDEVERHYVTRALEQAGGNKSKAARLIGLPNYQTLTNWMTRLEIEGQE